MVSWLDLFNYLFIIFKINRRVEVYNDGSDSIKFLVTLVREEEPSEDEEGYMYKIEAFVVRGLCKSAWKYYESGPWKLKDKNYFEKFIEKPERIKNVLHYGKDFEIEVFVKIFKLVANNKYIEQYDSMPCKLDALAHIKTLCKDSKHTDISINYKDIQHKCHKSVLAARSMFFASILKDAPDVVFYQFDDNDSVNEGTLAEFINFIYTGESQFQSLDNSRILMGLGNTFGIADLKEIHENVLMAHTTFKNALEMLHTAIKNKSCHGLKEAAFEFVKR